MHSGNTSTSYRALSSKTYVKLGEAAEAPFSPYYQCGLGQQHQVHKALGETGVWSSFTGLLATVTAEKASLAHYVPRGALLVGRGSGMEASVWRVEDSHLLILATLEAAFMLLEPFTVLW